METKLKPVECPGLPRSKTVSHFEEQVKLVIDWSIPNFSSLKGQTTAVYSDRTFVGNAAWSISLYPLIKPNHMTVVEDSTSVYVIHHFSKSNPCDLDSYFEISVLDHQGEKHESFTHETASQVFKTTGSGSGYSVMFTHADVWGPDPTLILNDDTLKLRVTIQYLPPPQTVVDRSRSTEPLQKKLRSMFSLDVGKDFTLVSTTGTERKTHRAVLSVSSPVFNAMLQSNMKENATSRCNMEDVSTDAMDAMLRFMYYDCTDGLKTGAREVLVAADKYQMADLKETCENILVTELTNETAVELLLLADKVSASILKDAALRYVAVNLPAMNAANQATKLFDHGDTRLSQEVISAVVRWGYKKV